MGTTPTTHYNLIKPNPFEEEDTWGPILNTNWDTVDTLLYERVPRDAPTGAALMPIGTTAQRPSAPTSGMMRFNGTTGKFEGYNGTLWGQIGGGAVGGGNDAIFIENDQLVTVNYTITTGKNAGSFGPITVNPGITVTVPPGSYWSVV